MGQEITNFKRILDNLLVANLFVVILGSILFISMIIGQFYGSDYLYNIFHLLWYPILLPSISIFFTAVIVEAAINRITKAKD